MNDNSDNVYVGKIFKVLEFGALVKLPDGSQGLVHISEISADYVNDVRDYLYEGMEVNVMVIGSEKGKKKLSIKQTGDVLPKLQVETRVSTLSPEEKKARKERKKLLAAERRKEQEQLLMNGPVEEPEKEKDDNRSFDDMLKQYSREAEARLADVKHQTDAKRGTGPCKRG